MNFKTTAILLIVLLAAGAAVYLTRESASKTETATPEADKKLLSFDSGSVERITIEPATGSKIVLKRDGMNWQMLEPLNTPADTAIPTEILSDLSGLQSTGKSSASGDDLAATGLTPPHFKVELVTKDGKSTKLDIGDRSGTGGGLYVRRDGDKQANLVAADVYDQLDKPVSEFRRKKLLDVNTTDVNHLELDRPEGKLVLQKTGSNWAVEQPTTMPADSSAVSDMVMGLSNLQATDFVSETDANPRRYGLDKPALTVSFTTAPGATSATTQATTLAATAPAPTVVKFGYLDLQKKNVYLTTSAGATVAQVAASTLDTFKKTPLELRDKQVLNVDPATISTVTVQTNLPATTQPTTRPASDKTVTLAHRPPTTAPTTLASTQPTSKPATPQSKWIVTSTTQPSDASDVKVTALLSALHPLKAEKYLQSAEVGEKPADHYTLSLESNPPLMASYKIELTDPGNAKPLVGSYNGLTFEVDRTLLDKLKADFTSIANDTSPTNEPASNAPAFPSAP